MNGLTLPEFQAMARDPRHWQRTTREFAIAANYLGDWYDADSDQYPQDMTVESQGSSLPMMVLYAVSVENLLKGIKVSRGVDPVSSGKLAGTFAHHDLVRHANEAGISSTSSQESLLSHLRDLIESGKYPVAKTPTKNSTAWHLRFPEDVEDVWSLLEYLEDVLIASGQPVLPKWNFRIRYRPVGYPKA